MMTTHGASGAGRAASDPPSSASSCPVLELRKYTLHPGQRDVLIDLFERELVETQEELGMRVVGSFRDLDDPDRFVWLRGFAGMSSRRAGLTAFYGGPVWAAHKAAANATMIDSDDVLLLRPVFPEAGFPTARTARPPVGSTNPPQSLVTATLFSLPHPVDEDVRGFFCDQVDPLLTQAGAPRLALLETEPAKNTFPALPVREGEHTVVRLSRFGSLADHAAHRERLQRSSAWVGEVQPVLQARITSSPQQLRLQPTARSLLR